MISLKSFASCLSTLHSNVSCRMLSMTSNLMKGYETWPYEKVRRIGRRPNAYRGQMGRKARIPYDKRYPLSGKDINDSFEGLKRGGNRDMLRMIGEQRKWCKLTNLLLDIRSCYAFDLFTRCTFLVWWSTLSRRWDWLVRSIVMIS